MLRKNIFVSIGKVPLNRANCSSSKVCWIPLEIFW